MQDELKSYTVSTIHEIQIPNKIKEKITKKTEMRKI